MNTCRNNRPYGFLLTANSFAFQEGGGPKVVISTAAFHARAWGSVPRSRRFERNKNVSSPSTCETQYCGEPS